MELADAAQVVVRFYRYLDDRDYPALAGLLTSAGEWHRQGKVLHGGEAVIAALSSRSPTMRIHHLLTNVFAVGDGADGAEVTAYMLVVRHEPGGPLEGPAPFAGIENIRTIRASLTATPEGLASCCDAERPAELCCERLMRWTRLAVGGKTAEADALSCVLGYTIGDDVPGDVVEVEITGLGTLRNPFVAEA